MSFSKAKLQRFNEFASEAPPPGAYDPKFDKKIKGLVIEKTGRFQTSKSVTSNGTGSSVNVSSKSAVHHPNRKFLTPRWSRRRVIVKPSNTSYTKTKLKSTNQTKDKNDIKVEHNPLDQLTELKVECSNKDRTIQENVKHIEEMKEEMHKLELQIEEMDAEICKLKLQIEELRKQQVEVEDKHKIDIETMAKMQQKILDDHDERHQTEINMLRTKLLDMSAEKEQEISTRQATENELRKRVVELSEKISILEAEVAKKIEISKVTKQTLQTIEAKNEELLFKLQTFEEERDIQIELLEKEKLELLLRVNDLTDNRCHLETKLEKRQNVILELQAQLSALQCELDELRAAYDKVVEDSVKQTSDLAKSSDEMETMREVFNKEKEDLIQQNELANASIDLLEAKIKDMTENNSFLQQELQDVQRLYRDLNHRLVLAHEELEIVDQKHQLYLKKHKYDMEALQKQHEEENAQLKQLLEEAREEYTREIENLTIARDKEMANLKEATDQKIEEETKQIKEHTNKIVENAEAVTRETLAACRVESEERVKKAIAESNAKVSGPHINAMIREATAAIEEEMRLNTEKYKACLARAETERAALNDKLAQKDAEITKLTSILEELRLSAETQESFSQSLQVELDRAETELADKKAELRALKDQIRAEAAEMVARRKRFEIVMAENQASVAALSKRLAQSHTEIERLQQELKHGEDCIHEHRDLLTSMRNNSLMVHDQVHSIMKQLDTERQLVDDLEAGTLSEFESLKSVFEVKIKDLQQVAAKEIARLSEEVKKKSMEKKTMKKQLDKMAGSLYAAQDMLVKLEERNDVQMIEISRLEVNNIKLQEQLDDQKKISEENQELLSTQSEKHKLAIEEANSKIEELSTKLECCEKNDRDNETKISSLEKEKEEWYVREKTFQKELADERTRRETAETEVKILIEKNDRLNKDYQNINEKYAEILGHQNHKQRIKHVSQLKEKINRLEQQELQIKSRQLEQQQKSMEKLTNQQNRPQTKGKENVIGILRSGQTTPTSSPHKPLTPLRDRNE